MIRERERERERQRGCICTSWACVCVCVCVRTCAPAHVCVCLTAQSVLIPHSCSDDDNDSQLDEDCAAPRAINGGWSLWSEWSDCSATFGQSAQKRSRACNSPPPVFSGLPCSGPSEGSTTGTSLDGVFLLTFLAHLYHAHLGCSWQ